MERKCDISLTETMSFRNTIQPLVLYGSTHIICQDYKEMLPGNKVIAGFRQDKLMKQGWEGSCLICDGNTTQHILAVEHYWN